MDLNTIKQLEASEIYAQRQKFTQAKNKILASIKSTESQIHTLNPKLDDLRKLADQEYNPLEPKRPEYMYLASTKTIQQIDDYTTDLNRQCTPCTETKCHSEHCLYFHTVEQMAYKQVLLAEKIERERREQLIAVADKEAKQYKGKYILLGREIKCATGLIDELSDMVRQYCCVKDQRKFMGYPTRECTVDKTYYPVIHNLSTGVECCTSLCTKGRCQIQDTYFAITTGVKGDKLAACFHMGCLNSMGWILNKEEISLYIRGDVQYVGDDYYTKLTDIKCVNRQCTHVKPNIPENKVLGVACALLIASLAKMVAKS